MAIWVVNKKKQTLFYWGEMGNEASWRNAEWWMTPILVLSYVILISQAFPKCIGKKLGQNNLRVQIFLIPCFCCLEGKESNSRNNESMATRTALPYWSHYEHNCMDVPCLHRIPGASWKVLEKEICVTEGKHPCRWLKQRKQLNMPKTFGTTASSMRFFCIQLTR